MSSNDPLKNYSKDGFIQYTSYSRITEKDIYQTLWKCRDFELSNLWQRSVFLTAFIVLSLTAYGYGILELVNIYSLNNSDAIDIQKRKIFFLVIVICINLIGIILSFLWIMMAKGSKAWYEKYEKAISAIERDPEISDAAYLADKKMMHGSLPSIDLNNNLFSTKAGGYSVSRINIVIGQLLLIMWTSGFLLLILFKYNEDQSQYWESFILFILLIIFIIVLACIFIISCRSGVLNEQQENGLKP